jgi:hypothetical protein
VKAMPVSMQDADVSDRDWKELIATVYQAPVALLFDLDTLRFIAVSPGALKRGINNLGGTPQRGFLASRRSAVPDPPAAIALHVSDEVASINLAYSRSATRRCTLVSLMSA